VTAWDSVDVGMFGRVRVVGWGEGWFEERSGRTGESCHLGGRAQVGGGLGVGERGREGPKREVWGGEVGGRWCFGWKRHGGDGVRQGRRCRDWRRLRTYVGGA